MKKTHYKDCRSKIRFRDEYEAQKHAKKFDKNLRVYWCAICEGYHLTSRQYYEDYEEVKKYGKI